MRKGEEGLKRTLSMTNFPPLPPLHFPLLTVLPLPLLLVTLIIPHPSFPFPPRIIVMMNKLIKLHFLRTIINSLPFLRFSRFDSLTNFPPRRSRFDRRLSRRFLLPPSVRRRWKRRRMRSDGEFID